MATLLRNPHDRRSLAFVGITLAALVLPHAIDVPLAWIALASVLCFIASIVNHNHMHCRTFRRQRHNLLYNLALSIARGHSATGIVVPHQFNHHKESGASGDWIRPALAGKGIGWLRLLRYVPAASLTMMVERARAGAPVLPARRQRSQDIERWFLAAVIGIALVHDWRVFLLFNAVPWLLGLCLLVGVNLLQHDACIPGESRNFTGRVGNWLFFNNGYHTAHHLRPSMHWSALPLLHAELTPRLPQQFTSILAYLWRFGWATRN
jgi:beta-carotene hydroxylase